MVSRIELGTENRVRGVHYFDKHGDARFQRAKAVIISGYSSRPPASCLNSACKGYENGLANSSGTLGPLPHGASRNVIWAASTSRCGCTRRRPPMRYRRVL